MTGQSGFPGKSHNDTLSLPTAGASREKVSVRGPYWWGTVLDPALSTEARCVHVNVHLPIDGLLISVRREIELANNTEKSKRPFNVTVPCLYEKYMETKSFLHQGAWKITEP